MNFNFDINAFQQIEERHLQDFDNVQPLADDDDEEQGNNGFSAEAILGDEDDQLMTTLCNFTCQQFMNIFNIVNPILTQAHSGGRHSKLTPKSILLITLTFLKSAMPLNNMSVQFGYSVPYLSKLITGTVFLCSQPLAIYFIRWIPMEQYVANHCLFTNFPQCICAVDGSVQEIPRPQENQAAYYSGKHHFHCLKMQVAVGPIGLAVDISGPHPGSLHDFKIFKDLSNTRYRIDAEKQRHQITNPGDPTVSALFDKGYIGVNNVIAEPKLPYRKSVGRNLTPQEIDYNNRIGQDRIIVERWFGRLKRIWRIMFECFPLKIEKYGEFYMMCAALTNYHIQHHSLTNGDPIDPFRYDDI